MWIALGALSLLVGFAGCLLPVLPGPPIAYLALVFAGLARGFDAYAPIEWIGLGVLMAVVTALDFVVPVWGAKRYGATRTGVWCAILGMLVGILFFPPFGMVVGTFVGAFVGESMAGQKDGPALRAAWGTFVGTMLGVVLKLACCAVIAYYFADAL